MKWNLTRAANGHILAHANRHGVVIYFIMVAFFKAKGFKRQGKRSGNDDEIVYPDFCKGEVVIGFGYDVWDGYYLLSLNDAGDRFLMSEFSSK